MPVERNESSNQGECSANKFSHLSVAKIIQEKNQLKPGDPKDHDMAERPSLRASTFAGRNEMRILAGRNEARMLAGRNEARMLAGRNEATTGGDWLTGVCSHLPLPNIIQVNNQLKPGDVDDHTTVEEPLPMAQIIQEKNQLKPGDPKNHDMAERPLPMAAGASTFAGRNEVRLLARQNEATTGGDWLTGVCSHLPLPNIIQEKKQLKPGDEEDHTMVEEPLPDIVQAATGITTVGTGYISNHGRMEENQSLIDCNQAPSVNKGAEVSPARDIISSGLHTRVHDTFLQPSNINQNPSELHTGEDNQTVVSRKATSSSIDKCTVTLSREGKSTLIGKKRERVDDTGLQPGLVNQNPMECENGKENQNAMSGNAMTSSLDKGTVAPSADGENTLIGKKGDGVHDAGLQPSLMVQRPTERVNEEENHNEVRADATSHDKGKVVIPTDGPSTLTGKKKDGHVLRKPSIMDRNPTARTHKWHDASVSSHGTSPNQSEKRQILRPKRTRVSDTKIPWNREFAGRRNKKWWSTDEEDTLRKAVEMFGVGNWTLIKNSYPAIFEERTSGDLKDKWRNMIK